MNDTYRQYLVQRIVNYTEELKTLQPGTLPHATVADHLAYHRDCLASWDAESDPAWQLLLES